jgi:ketosteroid isomerase-like protein
VTNEERDRLLRELLDEREIREVLYRYCHAIDRVDKEELRSVYHEDAYDDHGVFSGPASEFVEWVFPQMTEATIAISHLVGNVRIELRGDVAFVESYYQSISQMRVPEGARPRLRSAGGRYVDRFERRDGVWRIAHRRVIGDWDKLEEIELAYEPGSFPPGRRSRDDPSYLR